MTEKSYVTLEQKRCIVCGKDYDTNSLLLDRRLRSVFLHRTLTGMGLCPEHQKLHDDGYIALVGCDPEKSPKGSTIKPEDAYRTGSVAHLRRTVAREILNITIPDDMPMMFCDEAVINKLEAMKPREESA